MRIAVTGPKGQLGSELVRQGCLPLYGRLMSDQLREEINRLRPDAIINCAAMTNVDACEIDPHTAVGVNAHGVAFLIQCFDGYLVQVSTDYVFDGASGPYAVHHSPNPLSIYGWSKLGGELFARRRGAPWLIVRTTILFSQSQNNFVSKIIKQLDGGDKVKLYEPDLKGTPTHVPDLATELIHIVKAEYTGIAHIAGNQVITRWVFARMIAEAFGLSPEGIMAISGKVIGAPRPKNAGLICSHSGHQPINSHDPQDGLRELAKIYKESR